MTHAWHDGATATLYAAAWLAGVLTVLLVVAAVVLLLGWLIQPATYATLRWVDLQLAHRRTRRSGRTPTRT